MLTISLILILSIRVAVIATQGGVFDFPEYPPPMTPPANETAASGTRLLSANETATDPTLANAQLPFDTGTFGPQLELVHLYFNFWPTGVGVSSNGRIFTCFPRGNETFTLGEIDSTTTEKAWPSEDMNTPPSFVNASNPGFSISTEKFLFVQSVVVDGLDRVWALDTGRPRVNGTTLLAAVPGGPKLVGMFLNGKVFKSITFPPSVVLADSSLNDMRFDLRGPGEGFAYITDSAPQQPGIVVVNLTSGESWRHLNGHPAVSVVTEFLPVYNGVPTYIHPPVVPNSITFFNRFAADAIALSSDGVFLYISPLSSHRLFRVLTSVLKEQPSPVNPNAGILALQAVQDLGDKGSHTDGAETDSSGFIYLSAPGERDNSVPEVPNSIHPRKSEHNSINRFNPSTGLVEPFVRNTAIQFPDTLSVVSLANGGNFVYFTVNQLWLSPDYQNGTDLRTKPFSIFRIPISAGKANQLE